MEDAHEYEHEHEHEHEQPHVLANAAWDYLLENHAIAWLMHAIEGGHGLDTDFGGLIF